MVMSCTIMEFMLSPAECGVMGGRLAGRQEADIGIVATRAYKSY